MSMSIEQISIESVTNTDFKISDSYPVTDKVVFGENLWDFNDEKNSRLNSVDEAKLRIDWKEWEVKINKSITRDFKVICFVYLKCAKLVSKKNRIKPNSIIPVLKNVLSIYQKVIDSSIIEIGDERISLVQDNSDISISQFENVPITIQNQKEFKRILTAMANPVVSKFFNAKPTWNQADIKNLKLITKSASNIKELSTKPFADDFFMDMVKQTTLDVIGFKKYISMQIHTKVPQSYLKEISDIFKVSDLKKAFKDYVELRKYQRNKSIEHGKRESYASNLNKDFLYEHGVTVNQFYKNLKRIQRSAIFLLMQFTGVRYSDAVSFRKGCIAYRENGVYVIKGSHIKNNDSTLPDDIDEWVAVPIVRDSVEILELFQEFTFNSYLVSGLSSVYLNVEDLPFSLSGLTGSLNMYIKDQSETNKNFENYCSDVNNHISLHRLRHTLALHLVRAKLGVPYISFHLKHVHTAVVGYKGVSNTTLGYGGIANEIFHSAPAMKQARREFYEEIYNPKSPIAGGENAQEFKRRNKEYFQGLMVPDDEIEDVIADLKELSIPFGDVGLGYCGGKKDIIQKDGTKTPPPCIGQLKCNPIDCGNAIIPKSKLPIWKKMHKVNEDRLNDPAFSYAKNDLQIFVDQSRKVIEHLRNGV